MKKQAMLIAVLAACMLVPGFSASVLAVEYFWQVALEEIQDSMQYEYARTFVDALERGSNKKIRCKIHPYGELGTSGEITKLLISGNLQFAFQSPGHLGATIPEVQVFSIHYLFPRDANRLQKILRKGPNTYKVLGKYYQKHRLELLSIIQEGWQIWTADKPLRQPADFEGITFRVMSSPFLITAYRLYGAYVVTVPYSQVYDHLQLGSIHAQTQPFFAIQEMKFYEVQDYMIKADQLPFIATFAANQAFITQLPVDIRALIDDAVASANAYIFDLEPRLNEKRRQMIMQAKPDMRYIELTDDEIAAFRKKAQPLTGKFLKMGGEGAAEVLEAVTKDIRWAEENNP